MPVTKTKKIIYNKIQTSFKECSKKINMVRHDIDMEIRRKFIQKIKFKI